jgi:hypothetical protein
MTDSAHGVCRRSLLALGALLVTPLRVQAGSAGPRRLAFTVRRNGTQVGEHIVTFEGEPGAPVVTSEVAMTVRLGPVPIFRYRHHAVERWAFGAFMGIETTTLTNGRAQHVTARPGDGGVILESEKGRVLAPADAAPLTHWNAAALTRPLFNPQEGQMLKVRANRLGPEHWAIRGEAEIDDFYDDQGAWSGLRARLKDGSMMTYQRT